MSSLLYDIWAYISLYVNTVNYFNWYVMIILQSIDFKFVFNWILGSVDSTFNMWYGNKYLKRSSSICKYFNFKRFVYQVMFISKKAFSVLMFFFLIIFSWLEKAPEKSDLLMLMSGIHNRWYTIGVCLRIENGDLDSLNSSNQNDDVKLSKVLQLWIERMTKPVTWNTILEVIGSPPIQNTSVVRKIEKFLECEYLYNIPSNCTFVKLCMYSFT